MVENNLIGEGTSPAHTFFDAQWQKERARLRSLEALFDRTSVLSLAHGSPYIVQPSHRRHRRTSVPVAVTSVTDR